MGPRKEILDSGDSEGSMSGGSIGCLDVWMFGTSEGSPLTRSTSDGSADMDESVSGAHPEYTKVHRDCLHG